MDIKRLTVKDGVIEGSLVLRDDEGNIHDDYHVEFPDDAPYGILKYTINKAELLEAEKAMSMFPALRSISINAYIVIHDMDDVSYIDTEEFVFSNARLHRSADQATNEHTLWLSFAVEEYRGSCEVMLFELKSPIGAECLIRNGDEGEGDAHNVYISFGAYTEHHQHDGFGVHDDFIYYYADGGEDELKELMTPSAADFVVLNYEIVYEQPTKTAYRNNGHAMLKSQVSYKVLISRSASESCEVQVFAGDEASARNQALEIIESDDFEPDNWKLDDEIGSIQDVVATKCS